MLLDIRMPVLDGLAALPRILEVSPNTKVAVFSGLDPGAARPMALAEGAAIFIEKGDPLSVVIEALRGLCAPEAQPARELHSVHQRTQELERKTSELEARTEELQASMGELDAFAYTVSHDLRAPLRAMDGFSRILLEDHSDQLRPEATRYLQFIRRSAQDMQSLVDGLLAFSRLGHRALALVTLSPAVLIRQALSDLGDAAQRPDLHIEVDPGLPECQADPVLLKQVFVNLLSNSIKFTKGCNPARINVGFTSVNNRTVYFVRDNGVGFDSEYADKAFGVFQRLHRAEDFEGTGIGLAHVRRIVEKHDGRIWAEGHPGRGATFSFTIGTEGRS
jgi:light-regulated signal transduction histidine kinase (bacteriophytochrome)